MSEANRWPTRWSPAARRKVREAAAFWREPLEPLDDDPDAEKVDASMDGFTEAEPPPVLEPGATREH